MQETTVLYTARASQHFTWGRILHWLDIAAFYGIALVLGIIFWKMSTNHPDIQAFVRVMGWGMGISMVILGLMGLLNTFGKAGWWGLVPLVLVIGFWLAGETGLDILRYWATRIGHVGEQFLIVSVYGFGGLIGLGLLARLIEKIGVKGVLMTLIIAIFFLTWFIRIG